MYIHDLIYGSFDITEPVLLELLEEPLVKRAAKVMQGGTTPQLWGWPDFSRLEHCVGAMLLVRHLGGSLEEQIAALLHDVPHTVFSHVIDFVYRKDAQQNFHEEVKEKLFRKSHIPTILEKHGYTLDGVLDDAHFGLLEQPSPLLCADRVDYSLRTLPYYYNDLHRARYLAQHLTVRNGQIVFDSATSAVMFTKSFLLFARDCMAGLENLAAYHVFADAIRYALENGLLSEEQLFHTDDEVLMHLRNLADEFVRQRMELLVPGFAVKEDLHDYHYAMRTKMRWVNAAFVEGNEIKHALDVDANLYQEMEDYKERLQKPYYVRVVGL